MNFYSRRIVAAAPPDGPDQPFPWRVLEGRSSTERTDGGREIVPEALRELLLPIHRDYQETPTMVTENGAIYSDGPTHDGRVHDVRRQRFLRDHVKAVYQARAAGADVRGYFHWSLLDNFEWALGYRPRFGLVSVDYSTGQRIIKDSGRLYAEIASTGQIPEIPLPAGDFG